MALVYGQMNEPPGARGARRAVRAEPGRILPRRGRPGRAVLRGQHLPVHAGRRRSVGAAGPHSRPRWATSRRWPPTWARCRSGSPAPRRGPSPPCRRSTCPADDLTDPAPATSFAHLDATTVLNRAISEKGIYPAVDPLGLHQPLAGPAHRGGGALPGGARGAARAANLQKPAGHHRHPWHGRAERGRQGRSSAAPGASSASCRSRSTWPRCSPAAPASSCPSPTPSGQLQGHRGRPVRPPAREPRSTWSGPSTTR